ncbi:MAG: LPP20 family lipoprotein [Elusimicrobia bacterium]|nr:LPP20 family lipoprotein [Elusimicrobiota bacterium]
MPIKKSVPVILPFLAFALALSAATKKPAWVTGPDPKYPETKYVTGVGIGSDLDGARSNARAEIARTFQARVQQTLTDQQTESSTSSGKKRSAAQGTQKSQVETTLTTDTLLEGVVVNETYFDKKSKKNYALAVLDKVAVRRSLSTQIIEKEQTVSASKTRAEGTTNPLERARALSTAIEAARERDVLSTRRRVVDPSGMAELPTGSTTDLEIALEKAVAQIPVSVTAAAPEGSKLKDVVTAKITDIGVSISDGNKTGLAIKVKLEVTPFERGVPEWTFFQWTGTVELTDLTTGKVLASATPDGMEGHLTTNTARSKTIAAGDAALGQEAAKLLSAHLFNQ